jgi:ATP-binding cassette subfamily B protein
MAISLTLINLPLAGLYFVEPWLFGKIVDALTKSADQQATRYIYMWAAAGISGVALGVSTKLHADKLAHRRRLDLLAHFFEHVLTQPLSWHSGNHSARLLRILQGGTGSLFNIWRSFFGEHLLTILSMFIMLPLAIALNMKLGLLMMVLLVVFGISNSLAVVRTYRAQLKVEELHHEINERTGDLLGNVLVVQSFTRVSEESDGIRELSSRALAAQYPVLRWWAWLSVSNRTASVVTIIALFLLGSVLHKQDEVSVGQIVSFVGFSLLLMARMEQLAAHVSSLVFLTPSLRDFFAVLDTPADSVEQDKRPLRNVRGDIAFEEVSFGHDPVRASLKEVSFRVPAGTAVAIVGPTGSGKTTVLNLLHRSYDPHKGRVLIDGQDIRHADCNSVRRCIAVAFQDAGLLCRTISDNLRVGNPDATESEMQSAAIAAEAHSFIVNKPSKYSTLITESGRSLSGGERQRIAIARALLKDSPILMLDEATSALDEATEARVHRAIKRLRQGRTTFFVTHRLSTVRDMDLIIVLCDGQVVQQGKYEDLVRRDGLFAEMVRRGSRESGPS